mmetsp:Transcript_66979/g.146066  ORF Transcript_66979/g.146066 Transcript_66979/m.146066 type:complete len:214 (-) Transcript_66979:811-1452(-)
MEASASCQMAFSPASLLMAGEGGDSMASECIQGLAGGDPCKAGTCCSPRTRHAARSREAACRVASLTSVDLGLLETATEQVDVASKSVPKCCLSGEVAMSAHTSATSAGAPEVGTSASSKLWPVQSSSACSRQSAEPMGPSLSITSTCPTEHVVAASFASPTVSSSGCKLRGSAAPWQESSETTGTSSSGRRKLCRKESTSERPRSLPRKLGE